MRCPHCLTSIHSKEKDVFLGSDIKKQWALCQFLCPACEQFIFYLLNFRGSAASDGGLFIQERFSTRLIYPKGAQRTAPPIEVPAKFADDYVEACLVLPDSAKASAALSRRCLQHLLRDVAKVKHSDLFAEIQEVLDSGKLPTHIAESIDAVRNIGNFAAHPLKSKVSGEIVPVEEGEAEWNLDVLESLFDHYFVQPAILKRKRDALNAKLKEAGKPPMK